jgi:RNA polymerase sigma-70 factor (ECF subfamily)
VPIISILGPRRHCGYDARAGKGNPGETARILPEATFDGYSAAMNPVDPHHDTGEADGGTPLSPAEFADRFKASARLYWLVAAGVVRDASLADDVIQEAAIVALEKLDQFRPNSNLTAWMSQIVRNVAMNRARKEQRRRARSLDGSQARPGNEPVSPTIDAGASPGAGVGNDIDRRVLAALNEVGDAARACLLLRTIEGLDYAQIAALLEIPEGTAMSHVHRTRRFLRERLADMGPEAPTGRSGQA